MATYSYYTVETRGLPARQYGAYTAKDAAVGFVYDLKYGVIKFENLPTQLVVTSQAGNKWHVSLDIQLGGHGHYNNVKIVDFARITK